MGYETICLDVVAGYDPASLELSDQALPIELHNKPCQAREYITIIIIHD